MNPPREIRPHAFVRRKPYDPHVSLATNEWLAEQARFCGLQGCGLPYEAEPHWRLVTERRLPRADYGRAPRPASKWPDTTGQIDNTKHDYLPTGHETLACQVEGCGLSPWRDPPDKYAAFLATHSGPTTDFVSRKFAGYLPVPSEPKPDGWHTYHICGGILREVTSTREGALCPYCGEWALTKISLPSPSLPSRSDE